LKRGIIAKKGSITLQELIASIKNGSNFSEAGDIIIFSGVVRETSTKTKKKVVGIEIDSYDELAEKQLTSICTELIEEKNLVDLRICHYKGLFSVGETLVHCLIASRHRKEGIEVLERVIEEYKKRAYIWKREIYSDETSEWVSDNSPVSNRKGNY
jgi:molybdopterin synthase catalytic subunit